MSVTDTASNDYPTINTDKNYESWSKRHEITDKTVFNTMAMVRENYEKSRANLQSSCFWDAFQENRNGIVVNGGSWYDRWTLQEKMSFMWYRKSSADEFESNIKVPMSRGRINTFTNWMKKLNIEFGARPNNEDDKNPAFMANKTTNWWCQNSNFHQVLGDAWEDLAIHGNTYLKLSYVQEYRDYRFPKVTPEDLDKEEKEDAQKKMNNNEDVLVYGAPQHTLIIDDVVIEHVPLRELYPQPSGRNFHGDTYRTGWVIRKRYVTLSYLKAVFGDRPNVRYLDKVKGTVSYHDITEYFFQPPRDIMGSDIVELLEMEDQDNDCYYVIANDIPILGFEDEEPLPENHKEISYHKLDFIRVPGQFFSMGICDLLDNIQGSYEVGLNMIADYMYRTYNYRVLVDAENMGEIKQALLRTGDMFVPIDVSDGRPLNSKVAPLPNSPIGMDIFNFLELLEKQATLATNIDPAQMAQLAGSKTATSDMLNKELLMTMIGGVIENNVNGDLKSLGRQLWRLQQQHYPKARVKKIIGDEEQIQPAKTIRFEGIEIALDPDTKLLTEREVSNQDYTFFECTSEYLNTRDELDIYITPESKEISSQATDEANAEKELQQLLPFAVDPNNPAAIQQNPMATINLVKLMQNYIDVKRLPEDLLLNKDENNSQDIKDAEDDVMGLIANKNVEAEPGQSGPHLEYEYKVLDALIYQRDLLMKSEKDAMDKQMAELTKKPPQIDPMTGQPQQPQPPQPDPKSMKQLQDLDDLINRLQNHLMIESMPASMRNSRILQMHQGQMDSTSQGLMPPGQAMGQPQMEPPQGQMPPQQGGQPPMMQNPMQQASPAQAAQPMQPNQQPSM